MATWAQGHSRELLLAAEKQILSGYQALEHGYLTTAETRFQEVLKIDPGFPGALFGLGLVYSQQQDCARAIPQLKAYRQSVQRLNATQRLQLPIDPRAQQLLEQCEGAGAGLRVVVTPAELAQVWLNGELLGATPLSVPKLAAGTHKLRAAAAGHLAEERTIRIETGERRLEQFVLKRPARLDLSSRPPGATVVFDGVVRGVTPLALGELVPGVHTLELRFEPARPVYRSRLDLPAGESTVLNLPLALRGGELAIYTDPPGAQVTLDDEPIGTSPIELMRVIPGERRLSLNRRGHRWIEQPVRISADQPAEVRVGLVPVLLHLPLEGLPSDARLLVNGLELPVEDGWVDLPEGSHELMVEQEGCEPWFGHVRLRQEDAAAVRVHAPRCPRAARPWLNYAEGALGGGLILVGGLILAVGERDTGDVILAGGLLASGAVLAYLAWDGLTQPPLPPAPPPGLADLRHHPPELPPPRPTLGLTFTTQF